MPQKSNKANIIITAVAIIIILGGVFILNEAISSSNREEEETVVVEEPVELELIQEPEEEEEIEEEPEENLLPEPEERVEEESSDEPDEEESTENQNETIDANLEDGQVALKVLSIGTTNSQGLTSYQFEVVDSTFEDSKFFRTGATLNRIQLSGFSGVQEGRTYRTAISFTETESTFRINSIRNLGEI